MKITVAFIVFVVALVTVYDVWTLVFRGFDTTISAVMYTYAKQQPEIPFLAGFLIGHIVFPNRESRQDMQNKE